MTANLEQLRADFTADGNSSAVTWRGGEGHMLVEGSFGGGTLKLKWLYRDVTYIEVGASTNLTAVGAPTFTLPEGVTLRLELTGSAAPTLKATIL